MSFFKKALASIGIGNAKVDARLAKDEWRQGEEVRGEIVLTGGNVEQKIEDIYMEVCCTYIREVDDKKITDTAVLDRFRIVQQTDLRAGEEKRVPFSFILPYETPISAGNSKVWVRTTLGIEQGVDASDFDSIYVRPSELTEKVINTFHQLGFKTRKVENEYVKRYARGRYPFLQEFEFYPVSGPFYRAFDEVEVAFRYRSENEVDLLMEVDRRGRGLMGFLSEALEMDESKLSLSVNRNNVHQLPSMIEDVLKRYR
ncbi:sporulation protein [Bacillus litorisediminis]|uniref:sporulation protein n=1 Tax=Bacillus litorisediminis TaxID=2922713 RepID=UPI001FAD7107|nr:sporulation protein [Bacillus litorisediminis]